MDASKSLPREALDGMLAATLPDARHVPWTGFPWPARIALSPFLWTERVGRGRVFAFAANAAVMGADPEVVAAIHADYAAAGIRGDYQDLGLPVGRVRSLASWDGR